MSNRSEFAAAIEEAIVQGGPIDPKDLGDRILMAVTKALKAHLADKGQAVFPGFGRMKIETRAPRQGHNPKTGEPILIPAKQVVKFKVFPDGLS